MTWLTDRCIICDEPLKYTDACLHIAGSRDCIIPLHVDGRIFSSYSEMMPPWPDFSHDWLIQPSESKFTLNDPLFVLWTHGWLQDECADKHYGAFYRSPFPTIQKSWSEMKAVCADLIPDMGSVVEKTKSGLTVVRLRCVYDE